MHETIRDITYCILSARGPGLAGLFFPATADPGLPYRRFFHWSIRHGLGQVPGIDPRHLRVILFAALGQLAGGCVLGILFFAGIGFSIGGGHSDVLYLCVACALSSTVIIVEVLYESASSIRCPDASLSASWCFRISSQSFLAVQLSLDNLQIGIVLPSIGRVCVLVATALALSRYVLPRLFHQIAPSRTGPA
jgi:Kef-type K+ transport system membrane component KefB